MLLPVLFLPTNKIKAPNNTAIVTGPCRDPVSRTATPTIRPRIISKNFFDRANINGKGRIKAATAVFGFQ